MEFGPRALGARSILGDPRSDKMQKNLNLKVKFRESFRPCTSVLKNIYLIGFLLMLIALFVEVANINSEKIEMTDNEKKLFE